MGIFCGIFSMGIKKRLDRCLMENVPANGNITTFPVF